MIPGRVYFQTSAAFGDNGVRSAQPFCCPRCGTDYASRPKTIRTRSPIRAFRTGTTKASQLVATEMFEFLHAIGSPAKSIVFSDSRQDAANQGLEIERLHLRDLRREIFVAAARDLLRMAMEGRVSEDDKRRIIQELLKRADGVAALQVWRPFRSKWILGPSRKTKRMLTWRPARYGSMPFYNIELLMQTKLSRTLPQNLSGWGYIRLTIWVEKLIYPLIFTRCRRPRGRMRFDVGGLGIAR